MKGTGCIGVPVFKYVPYLPIRAFICPLTKEHIICAPVTDKFRRGKLAMAFSLGIHMEYNMIMIQTYGLFNVQ